MRTKATYKLIEFVRPNGSYWPTPYSTEQAFGVLRWMIDIGKGYDYLGNWGRHTPEGLLSCKASCTGIWEINPITSLKDLETRFHHAILTKGAHKVKLWKTINSIHPGGVKIIHFPHATPYHDESCEHDIRQCFTRVFTASGRLNVQLNECHNRAREIYGVRMRYHRDYPGWRFELQYGFDGSVWYKTIARQRPSEPLIPVLKRAAKIMDDWTER